MCSLVDDFDSDTLAKELNSAMSDLPSFDSGLVTAVLKDMWSKVTRERDGSKSNKL